MTSEETVKAVETILSYSGLTDEAKYEVIKLIVDGKDKSSTPVTTAHGVTSIWPSDFWDAISKDNKSGIEIRNE